MCMMTLTNQNFNYLYHVLQGHLHGEEGWFPQHLVQEEQIKVNTCSIINKLNVNVPVLSFHGFKILQVCNFRPFVW